MPTTDKLPWSTLSKPTQQWAKELKRLYAFESHHERLLYQACQQWDRAEQARAVLNRDGVVYTDGEGRPRRHPAVGVELAAVAQFKSLLRELAIDAASTPTAPRAPNSRLYGGRRS